MDNPTEMKVNITSREIVSGVRKHSHSCAITEAIRRDYGDKFSHISTGIDSIYLGKIQGHPEDIYKMPQNAIDWRNKFDKGGLVNPVSFVITKI